MTPLEGRNPQRVEARVIFCCSEFADAPITVSIDNQEVCTLERGTFYRLRLPPPRRDLRVTLTAKGKTIEATLTPELFYTEVCLLRTAKGEPKLDLPDGDLRKRLLREAADGELQEKCKE